MVKRRKGKGQSSMEVDNDSTAGWTTEQAMDTSDFVPLEQSGAPKQKDHMGVKIRPKRGKSSQKQKRRLAMKLDKALAVADRKTTKSSKQFSKTEQKKATKQLWVGKAKGVSLQ
ncbi:g7601 [Coccomyxa elongata]